MKYFFQELRKLQSLKHMNLIIFGNFTVMETIKIMKKKNSKNIKFHTHAVEMLEAIRKNCIHEYNKRKERKERKGLLVFSEHDVKRWIKKQNKIQEEEELRKEMVCQEKDKYDIDFSVSLFELYHRTNLMIQYQALEYQINLYKKNYGNLK